MPATSTALTGLSIAANIAREATDGVPIVKQVLGVAARILSLAEQIDKNREELRALAECAKKMEAIIASVTAGRELDEDMLRRLEGITSVLLEIEELFAKCVERGRLVRVIGYIFTVPKEVERLKGAFDARLRELQVAIDLETNILTRNARFIGQFRNIRQCEIDLLRRITPPQQNKEKYAVNCHLATCDGTNGIVVVRDIVSSVGDEDTSHQIDAHEKIQEEMSMLPNRHPTIAYLYGRISGPQCSRFAILKAGDILPLQKVMEKEFPMKFTTVGRVVANLADASHHLQRHGAEWAYGLRGALVDELYFDERNEPKIGVVPDLAAISTPPEPHIHKIASLLANMIGTSTVLSCIRENRRKPRRLWIHTDKTQFFDDLFDAGYCTLYGEVVIRRADISSFIPFSKEACTYLSQVENRWENPDLGELLLLAALGSAPWEGIILRATYIANTCEKADYASVVCTEDYGETLRQVEIRFQIPPSSTNYARMRAGGLVADHKMDEQSMRYTFEQIVRPGETPSEAAEWRLDPIMW